MKFLQRGFLAACFALSALTALAGGYRSIRLELIDGEAVEIQLSDNLKTKFTEQYMTFVDGTRVVVKVPKTNVSRMSFLERDAASISEVDASVAPRIFAGRMIFSALPAGSKISVADASGRTLLNQSIEGEYTLNLQKFAPGVYVVVVNGLTYKISVR